MPVAVITASASIIVAVLVFVLNQWGQVRAERRRARLDRVNAQLQQLYGPLKTLADANEAIWRALRADYLPDAARRRSSEPLSQADWERWAIWVESALMPANRQMRDLIMQHAHLLIEVEMPEPLLAFCSHVAAYEVALATDRTAGAPASRPMIRHPGDRFLAHLRDAFTALKAEQERLLRAH
jgi:hypothetical protein